MPGGRWLDNQTKFTIYVMNSKGELRVQQLGKQAKQWCFAR